jgi:hypothetical protein
VITEDVLPPDPASRLGRGMAMHESLPFRRPGGRSSRIVSIFIIEELALKLVEMKEEY